MLRSNKPSAEVTIRNRKGLHARASAKFVKCAESFDATVRVMRDGQTVGHGDEEDEETREGIPAEVAKACRRQRGGG